MKFEFLGRPPDGPVLDLDHEEFPFAGKFAMSSTGKAVVRKVGTVLGATAFNEERTDEDAVRIRYVAVRDGYRGQRIGPQLLRFTAAELVSEYDVVAIAVNTPIAYQACYRAGFVSTGMETGIAEVRLVYEPTSDRSKDAYQDGVVSFTDRQLSHEERTVLERIEDDSPPSIVPVPR